MDDFNEYIPGQAYANLKDEMVSEYTLGQPRLPTGTTTYKSGATSTTTATPYGYHLQMDGRGRPTAAPEMTPGEEFIEDMANRPVDGVEAGEGLPFSDREVSAEDIFGSTPVFAIAEALNNPPVIDDDDDDVEYLPTIPAAPKRPEIIIPEGLTTLEAMDYVDEQRAEMKDEE